MRILGIDSNELKRIEGYNTSYEMVNQPNLWLDGVNIIKENRSKIESFLNEVFSIEGLKIYLVGAGSSAKAASIVQNYILRETNKEVFAIASTALLTHPEQHILDDSPVLLVSLGSSGNTTEALEAVEIFKSKSKKLYQLLIICSEEGEIVKRYMNEEEVLYIPIPKETKGKSFAATGEFTLLVQYALMIFDIHNFDYYNSMFKHIVSDVETFFKEDIYKVHAISNRTYDNVVSLGSNVLTFLASEMCLKISELSSGLQSSEFHSILEFRHGPKLVMNSNTLITFFFSQDDYAIKYEKDMLKECYQDKKNSTIVAVSMNYDSEIDENSDYYFCFNKGQFNYLDDSHIIFQYSIYLQALAILKSIQLKVSPDHPDQTGAVNKVAQGVNIYKTSQLYNSFN
ncbi:SIS domain-containing protein [Tepidibacillus sp. HK-1]|uniref:SIS domain-containing protein n=1 Tax=Tepidibacillus sp. HK-1 TaxID=1883407 RepID=UPI00085354AA|nr:SIS domain-containing protein [Tepidibacillus sp. HK-1]GBF10192.1 putative tagatose-6-phosphate ketose/aldose isomerase [Tepidibacillus sp. HK-1]